MVGMDYLRASYSWIDIIRMEGKEMTTHEDVVNKAWAAYVKARDTYYEAYIALEKAWAVYYKAWRAQN